MTDYAVTFIDLSELFSPLLAAVAALIGHSLVRWWRRPRLSIEAGSGEPFIRGVSNKDHPGEFSTWIRIRVRNDGRAEALSVRAYLSDSRKEGEQQALLFNDAIPLWASSGGDGGPDSPLTVSREFGRFFDVACYYKGDTGLRIPSTHLIGNDPLGGAGTYFLKVKLSGANFTPVSADLRIEFSGDSMPVTVSLVSAGEVASSLNLHHHQA